MTTDLTDGLRSALKDVTIAQNLRAAWVGDVQIEAESTKTLKSKLGHALYRAFHTGYADQETPASLSLDPLFQKALASAIPHTSTRLLGHVIDPDHSGDEALVQLSGVRVRVPAPQISFASEVPEVSIKGAPPSSKPALVEVPAMMPARSPGFLLVHGSRGHGLGSGDILRLYVHLPSHENAPDVWGRVLRALEDAEASYQAKILSRRTSYPRRDALVIYLGPGDWSAAPRAAEAAISSGHLGPDVSLFAAEYGTGVGWAWEPKRTDPSLDRLSFGQHRAHIVADALVEAAETGVDPEASVMGSFLEALVPPEAPYRNLGSPEPEFLSVAV